MFYIVSKDIFFKAQVYRFYRKFPESLLSLNPSCNFIPLLVLSNFFFLYLPHLTSSLSKLPESGVCLCFIIFYYQITAQTTTEDVNIFVSQQQLECNVIVILDINYKLMERPVPVVSMSIIFRR